MRGIFAIQVYDSDGTLSKIVLYLRPLCLLIKRLSFATKMSNNIKRITILVTKTIDDANW